MTTPTLQPDKTTVVLPQNTTTDSDRLAVVQNRIITFGGSAVSGAAVGSAFGGFIGAAIGAGIGLVAARAACGIDSNDE